MPFAVFYRDWPDFTEHSPYWCFDFTSDEDLDDELRALAKAVGEERGVTIPTGQDPIDVVGNAAGWFEEQSPILPPEREAQDYEDLNRRAEEKAARAVAQEHDLAIPPLEHVGPRYCITEIPTPIRPSPATGFHITEDERVAIILAWEIRWSAARCRTGYHYVQDAGEFRRRIVEHDPEADEARARRRAVALEENPQDVCDAFESLAERAARVPPDEHRRIRARRYRTVLPAEFEFETPWTMALAYAEASEAGRGAWRNVPYDEAIHAARRRLKQSARQDALDALAAIRDSERKWFTPARFEQLTRIPKQTIESASAGEFGARRGGQGEDGPVEVCGDFIYWFLGYKWDRRRKRNGGKT